MEFFLLHFPVIYFIKEKIYIPNVYMKVGLMFVCTIVIPRLWKDIVVNYTSKNICYLLINAITFLRVKQLENKCGIRLDSL